MAHVPSRSRRYAFHQELMLVSGLPDSHIHFQPPNGTMMAYPAITYSRNRETNQFADNLPYLKSQGYTVTVIHEDPDNDIRDAIASMPNCSFDRWYAADRLNHDVYTIYF